MKLLLGDKEIEILEEVCVDCGGRDEMDVARAQLDKIFNLDIETTVNLIDKLRKRLDKLYEKEIDNGSNH